MAGIQITGSPNTVGRDDKQKYSGAPSTQIEGTEGKLDNVPDEKEEVKTPGGDYGESYGTTFMMNKLEKNKQLFEADRVREGLYGAEPEPEMLPPGKTPLG